MRLSYSRAIGLAIVVHGVLAVGFLISFAGKTLKPASTTEAVQKEATVIDSALVSQSAVETEIARLDSIEKKRIAEEKEKTAQLEKVKKENALEKKKLTALKKEVDTLKQQVSTDANAKIVAQKEKEEAQKIAEKAKQKEAEQAAILKKKQEEEVATLKKQELDKQEKAEKALKAEIDRQKKEKWLAEGMDQGVREIIQQVSGQWLRPIGLEGSLFCRLKVKLLPTGSVLSVEISESSGHLAFDRSAEAAVRKASPLPLPDDQILREKLREFTFTFKPEEI